MSSRSTMLTMPPIASAPCLTEIESSCTSTRSTALSGSWFRSNAFTREAGGAGERATAVDQDQRRIRPEAAQLRILRAVAAETIRSQERLLRDELQQIHDRRGARALDRLAVEHETSGRRRRQRCGIAKLDVMTLRGSVVLRLPLARRRCRARRALRAAASAAAAAASAAGGARTMDDVLGIDPGERQLGRAQQLGQRLVDRVLAVAAGRRASALLRASSGL